jgi:hypothetical protein
MRFPNRFPHLATRAVVTAKLFPTYASSHQVDDDEADEAVPAANLAGRLACNDCLGLWCGCD